MNQKVEYISIINNTQVAKIPVEDIEVVEQAGRKLHVYTANKEYICYEQINNLAEALVERGFYRVMKSMIVNFDQIVEIKDGDVTFRSGKQIWIGRNNYYSLKKAFKNYVMKYPPFAFWEPKSILAEKDDYKDI